MNGKTIKNLSIKRKRTRPQHKWTKLQTDSLLQGVLGKTKGDPERFEKPTSNEFYNSIFQEYYLKDLEMLGAQIVKNKMRNLKDSFLRAEAWIADTGAKLLEEGNQEQFKENLDKICLNYNYLAKIFGFKNRDESFSLGDNGIVFIEMNSPEEILKSEYVDYETASEEYETIIDDPLPEVVNHKNKNYVANNFKPLIIKKTKTTEQFKKPNPFIEYMTMTQENRNKIEEKKIEMQTIFDEERFQIEQGMLQAKREKFDLYQRMEEKRFDLEKKQIEGDLELKKRNIEKQYELKKYELELKYKCNHNK